ncbi:sigma-like protein [Streptomyces sp. NPDC005573]|uniref:sigma-like protein n=1 Tax=unclassified Streptomyces TaxID=2593676 RepID=UPI0033BE8122
MTNAEKKPTEIVTMENHSPVPPAGVGTPEQKDVTAAPSADAEIITLENHSPVPPALDLGNK